MSLFRWAYAALTLAIALNIDCVKYYRFNQLYI